MGTQERAGFAALAVLAAITGMAAAGLAVLAHAGFHVCSHHVALLHGAHPAMSGMAMPGTVEPVPDAGVCPVVLYAALVAAALSVLALIALAGSRAAAPAALLAAARVVSGLRVMPLTGVLGLVGTVPLVAILAGEGVATGLPALGAFAALLIGAFLAALALAAAARVVLSFARRLAVALAAAFKLLVPGADRPWTPRRAPVLAAAGVRLARRRPSRAPPSLRT
ncbi:MAG TPA: hypothetical protein VFF00_02930 [Candidatus Elarobacter sp.]|nr:hypothetical protein [Candidatus Elarobacter sp.]